MFEIEKVNSIKIPKSLGSILEDNVLVSILDKSSDIVPIVNKITDWWKIDLFEKKPSPAYTLDGEYQGTDLDIASFLYALYERGATINIPVYKSMRQNKVRKDEVLVSKENRHGKIHGLVSNKNTFSFSVRIIDMNVMTNDKVGAFRAFSLTDVHGEWYKEWRNLVFIPTEEERKFIEQNEINIGSKIVFTYFVSPYRWKSMYSKYYLLTKALINRIEEECKHYYFLVTDMLSKGIKFPESDPEFISDSFESTKTGEGTKIKVKCFETELILPEIFIKYKDYEHNQANLVLLYRRRKNYLYTLLPKLRYITRSIEYAHYFFNKKDEIPNWLNLKWEPGYREKGKRIQWDLLPIAKENNEIIIGLKKREYEKTETVSNT